MIPDAECRWAGVDLSLASTGIAVGRPCDGPPETFTVGYSLPMTAPEPDRAKRIDTIADEVWALDVAVVVLEDLLPGMKQVGVADTVGLHHVVRRELRRVGTPYVLVHPSRVKLYAVGKGGGKGTKKRDIALAVARRYGLEHVTGDETDGFVLWALAAHHCGAPLATVPERNAEAVGKVDWTLA